MLTTAVFLAPLYHLPIRSSHYAGEHLETDATLSMSEAPLPVPSGKTDSISRVSFDNGIVTLVTH